MSSRDLFELEPGDTGEAIRLRRVHNHDLDPTCKETRIAGTLLGECLTRVHSDRDRSERPWRYSQCDDTCTTDCGHCKGAGAPGSRSEADKVSDRGADAAYNTEPEHILRYALAWVCGFDPDLYAKALRRAHGDWT